MTVAHRRERYAPPRADFGAAHALHDRQGVRLRDFAFPAILIAALACAGCRVILGVDEKIFILAVDAEGGGGEGGDEGPGVSLPLDCPAGQVTCDWDSPCTVNLSSDPQNCGRCDRSCGDDACTDGR